MVGGPSHGLAPRNKPLAGLQRDAALIRVSRTRRALFVGAVALSAGLAAVVSAIAPGRSLGAKPTFRTAATGSKATTTASISGASANRSSAAQMPPLASPSELGLQAPDAAPQAAPGQSGGSSGAGSTSQQTTPDPAQQAASQPAPAPAPASGGVVSGGS
jgi:hypothetical protein